jgi:hypothetical protein
VTEKGEAEFGVGADSIQAVFGDRLNVSARVTAEVGELGGLEIAEYLLSWIELRRVAGRRSTDNHARWFLIQSVMHRLRWAGRPSHTSNSLRPGSS